MTLRDRWLTALTPSLALAILCCPTPTAATNGLRVYRNEEYGIETRFPAESRVCEALSGDHPIGFYAWLGRQTDCDVPKPPSVSAVNVTALYNTAFYTLPPLSNCRNGSVPRGTGINLRGLAFRRLRSISCAIRREDGSLEIFVAAQGGRWRGRNRSAETSAPLVNYSAVLKTNPARLERDMATFRTFLSDIVIRHVTSG